MTMKFRPTYRNIWGISFPIIIAGIGETIVDITDTIFLAHYGVTELAAVGLADAIYGVALFLSLGLVDGIQITIGRRAGQDQPEEIGRVFNQGLYLLSLVSIVLILVILFVVPVGTRAVFSSLNVHDAVNSYLHITAYALLFQSFNLAYSAFYIGISKTRVLIGATAVLATSNILLDYILIFGNFGLPEMGIEGAAVASITAEIAAFLFLTRDILVKGYARQYGLLQFSRWSNAYAVKLSRISLPVSMEALVETVKWFLFFLIIEQLGENTLASATIIYSCYALFLMPIDSFAETVCTMVSNLIGQQRIPQLKLLIRRTIKLSYMVIAPLLLFSLFLPDLVLSIFTPDEKIIDTSFNSLYVVILISLLAVPSFTYYAAVFGTGDTPTILLIQIIMTVCTIGIAYYFGLYLGLALEYIWLAEMAGWLICLVLSWYWFKSERWKKLEI
jgi:putative MATE family efflux protein